MALNDVKDAIKTNQYMMDQHGDVIARHEVSTRYVLIDPIVRALGWCTSDPIECQVEYPRGGRRKKVDYVLMDREGNSVILLEAKSYRLYSSQLGFVRQLAGYTRGMTRGVGALTDGQYWHIYDLGQRGRFQEKLTDTVDTYNDQMNQAARTLNRWLRKSRWW